MGLKFPSALASVLAGVCQLVIAQNPSTTVSEAHPQLPTWKCTTSGGCVQQSTSVVLDWEYRNIHSVNGTASCKDGSAANSQCPNAATCAKNCVVDGADYKSFGVSTSGNAVTMYHYVRNGNTLVSASPRIYLLNGDGNYAMLSLLNQEFSVDVDLSTLPCGENGALYLSEMAASPKNEYQTGGANYGSGYCDAQSPVLGWRNGTVNTARQGYGCNEMDIIEANSRAHAFTGHPCRGESCDKPGCGINPYSSNKNYYGPGGQQVDTSKMFTVVMQFPATGGSLSSIVRKFVQNGKTTRTDTLSSCGNAATYGGLAGMGEALKRGMVLAFAIWNDAAGNMTWLDSGNNGPCKPGEGAPANIQAQHPDTHVIFSNIRWGDIGSTSKS